MIKIRYAIYQIILYVIEQNRKEEKNSSTDAPSSEMGA